MHWNGSSMVYSFAYQVDCIIQRNQEIIDNYLQIKQTHEIWAVVFAVIFVVLTSFLWRVQALDILRLVPSLLAVGSFRVYLNYNGGVLSPPLLDLLNIILVVETIVFIMVPLILVGFLRLKGKDNRD